MFMHRWKTGNGPEQAAARQAGMLGFFIAAKWAGAWPAQGRRAASGGREAVPLQERDPQGICGAGGEEALG